MGRKTRLAIALAFFVLLLVVALVPILKSFFDPDYRAGPGPWGLLTALVTAVSIWAIGKK